MKKIILPQNPFSTKEAPPNISRQKSVFQWQLPQEGSPEWVQMRLELAAAKRDPRYAKELRVNAITSSCTTVAIDKNGAGLPADAGLREFAREYNNRTSRYGLNYLPISFNIFESFLEYIPKYGIFIPLVEMDHLCKISGLLDYISTKSNGETSFLLGDLNTLSEGVIHNYSFLDRIGDWFFGECGSRYSIVSASIVRHGSQVTVICLAGQEADLDVESKNLRAVNRNEKRNPHKPGLEIDPTLVEEAVPLTQNRSLWRTYLAFRFDIESNLLDARYLLHDNGNRWNIKSDDPITLRSIEENFGESDISRFIEQIESSGSIFTFLVRLLNLPFYFNDSATAIVLDNAKTDLTELNGSARDRKSFERSLRNQIIYQRSIKTLPSSTNDPGGVIIPGFTLGVEVEGYWERLPFNEYGIDKDGNRIVGKTWVRKTLAMRRAKIDIETLDVESKKSSVLLENDAGYIYVMRNASHQLDVFKIGLTRRSTEVRASELSRHTGVPDKFLVVQRWSVFDVVYAEKRIHQLLSEYRLTDSREFFRAEYSLIRSTIDLVIGEMAGSSVD